MDALECIEGRMSIRKFKPEPVPKATLFEVIKTAQRSPSYKNSQPWEVAILSGEKKKALSQRLVGLLNDGIEAKPDIAEPTGWPEAIQKRIDEMMSEKGKFFRMDLTDPALTDKAKKANFNFYGAPHAIYLYQDATLSEWSLFDAGLFAQSLMLAAHAHGIGSVPQAYAVDYSQEVKRFLDIPESKRLLLGFSVGYPMARHPANRFRTDRVDSDEIVRWIE